MNIISYKPAHDGAIAYVEDGCLSFSIEAEKNSKPRFSSFSLLNFINVLSGLDSTPDVLCVSGWWPDNTQLGDTPIGAGYRGISPNAMLEDIKFLGSKMNYFSSSHERSHLLCSYALSPFPQGTPCYALIWEGVMGNFYEIDADLNITLLGEVLNEPGHRYALLYGLADPTFQKDSQFSRFSDAGKLMALAAFATREEATEEEKKISDFLLKRIFHLKPIECEALKETYYYNVGLDDQEFRNFAKIFSNRIFDEFYHFAKSNMKKRLPLLISGGCGLNCDWNTQWKNTGCFDEVFVPPVANDSGSAIGTAADAQFCLTGNAKLEWSVYSGEEFIETGTFERDSYDIFEASYERVAQLLTQDFILGWVQGKYEIGPRALGNRSILAAPFSNGTRVRLNDIKQREQFRPIAPVCIEEDAGKLFDCDFPSPHMLYFQKVKTTKLSAVTHVDNTARIQTVSKQSNEKLYELLSAFRGLTGFGVLCNTSLNFKRRGFINNISDLCAFTRLRELDGFVVGRTCYIRKSSSVYQFKNRMT